ncbi:MAG TPA: glycosyltransferase family 4 protein [Candidatus Limnocylindria bacterium]|nr:glycosyltransferase family 4 protein [Candidatus Limnocylindria bacterium]
MKIGLVELDGKGGMIHYAWQLACAMQERGAAVTLITSREFELASLPRKFEVRPVLEMWDSKPESDPRSGLARRVRRLGRAARYYREWARATRELAALRPDVIQLGDIRFASDILPLRRLRPIAPVLADVCHNVHPFSAGGRFGLSGVSRRAYERIYRTFDAIFVQYDTNLREFAATFPDAAPRAHRIVHGNERIFDALADPTVSPRDLRRRLELRDGERVVLFFGTLSRYKGIDLLLRAFHSVAARVSDVRLVVAGFPLPDFDPQAFRSEIAATGLGDRVLVVPRYIDAGEVRAWMELGDVLAFPHRSVFQSGTLHLACTYGRPLVATRVGANEEVVRDGETGLLVAPGDEEELAAAIVRLLDEPELARSFGTEAARDAADRLSWDRVADTMLTTYARLLDGRQA